MFIIIILCCILPVGGFTVNIHCVMIVTVVGLCLTATVLYYAIGVIIVLFCFTALDHVIMIQCYIDSVIIVLLCFTALCHNDSVLH